MADESNVWEGIRDLLELIEERMDAAFSAEEISVTPAGTIALGICSRCMSLFRGIVILLSNNQPEEALMLWRGCVPKLL